MDRRSQKGSQYTMVFIILYTDSQKGPPIFETHMYLNELDTYECIKGFMGLFCRQSRRNVANQGSRLACLFLGSFSAKRKSNSVPAKPHAPAWAGISVVGLEGCGATPVRPRLQIANRHTMCSSKFFNSWIS